MCVCVCVCVCVCEKNCTDNEERFTKMFDTSLESLNLDMYNE